ncbi:MAG: lysozyme inhibitor LprI family protein [Pseudomonadota bacterium]
MKHLALIPLIALATPVAGQELVFDPGATASCVAAQETDHAALLCVGRSATACMDLTEGGTTTVGMGGCLDRERAYWDTELNAAYQDALADAQRIDAEAAEYGFRTPPMEEALRAMQRAWISYRDELCTFERSKWGGGTGGGPATAGCLMQETARQTLLLRRGVGLE